MESFLKSIGSILASYWKSIIGMIISFGVATTLAPLMAGVLTASVVGGSVYFIKSLFSGKSITMTSATFVGAFPADRLYTSHAIVPAIFLKTKDTEYDSQGNFKSTETYSRFDTQLKPNQKLTGFCFHEYHVGFGYENVSSYFLNKDYIKAACSDQFNQLPTPTILLIDSKKSDNKKDFSREECDLLNKDSTVWESTKPDSVRRNYIIYQLKITNAAKSIAEKSQAALGSFLKLNCASIIKGK